MRHIHCRKEFVKFYLSNARSFVKTPDWFPENAGLNHVTNHVPRYSLKRPGYDMIT